MKKYIFISAFLFVCFFQWLTLTGLGIVDLGMWAHQAQYVQTGDQREFNALWAYGHPGGPVIDGTIAIHNIFKISYDNSIVIFLTVFNALISAFICLLCYFLDKDHFWWISILGVLGLDMLYEVSTPPSAVASLLVVLLCLLTLFLYKNKEKINVKTLTVWSLVGGLAVATRADIGSVSVFVFALLLIQTVGWKKIFYTLLGSFTFFCFFDPFMWFMPIQHIRDLLSKVIYHYAEFSPVHMTTLSVVSISSFAIVSIFLSVVLIFMRKKIQSIAPPAFVLTLIAMTVALYAVFLSANYKAPRYFMPIIFIWEIFLPSFIFSLVSNINFDFLPTPQKQEQAKKITKIFVMAILIGYPLIFLCQSFWINYTYHLLPGFN
jgi:hypothetical protein